MTACYASTVSRTSYWWCSLLQKNVLNLEPSSWCGEPFSWPVYWWTETRTRSHSSTYRNNWPSVDWVAKHSFQNSWEANQNWLRFTCARFQWRYVNRLTLIRTKTINQLNLLRKWRRKNKVRRLCCDGCHWENSTLKKYMYGTTARRKKKVKPL